MSTSGSQDQASGPSWGPPVLRPPVTPLGPSPFRESGVHERGAFTWTERCHWEPRGRDAVQRSSCGSAVRRLPVDSISVVSPRLRCGAVRYGAGPGRVLVGTPRTILEF